MKVTDLVASFAEPVVKAHGCELWDVEYMITGYIFVSALSGSIVRDYTPEGSVGKLQGVRMVASVLIPMLIGPAIGNGINRLRNVKLPNLDSADAMTTSFVPAPEIFLIGALFALALFAIIPILAKYTKK